MSSGVAWIDRKLGELFAAREFLTGIGLVPQPNGNSEDKYRGASNGGWRVPFWSGVFTDDQLIEFARERGFQHERRKR